MDAGRGTIFKQQVGSVRLISLNMNGVPRSFQLPACVSGDMWFMRNLRKGGRFIVLLGTQKVGMRQVGFIGNSGLPGNKRYPEVITDPNKQTETITCPVRELDLEIPLNDAVDFNHFKIEFNMEGALFWVVYAVDFSTEPSFGKSSDTGPYDSKRVPWFQCSAIRSLLKRVDEC